MADMLPHQGLTFAAPARLRPLPRLGGRAVGVTYYGPGGWPDLAVAGQRGHDSTGERQRMRDAETRSVLSSGTSPVAGYITPAPPGVTPALPAVAQPDMDPGKGKRGRGDVRGVRPPQIAPQPMRRTWEL